MRSKNILSIVAFITAFAFSTVLASFFIPIPQNVTVDYTPGSYRPTSCFAHRNKSATAVSISALIRQDEINSTENRPAFDDFDDTSDVSMSDYAESVESYVDASSRINADNLPRDFQKAWREHMKAWRNQSNFLNRMKNSPARKAINSEDFNDIEAYHNREISRTWNEVLRIGASYGADIR